MKKSDYIVCTAKIVVKKDSLEEALEIFKSLKINTPNEPGCLRYELHCDIEHDNIFLFVDRFKNMEAFDSHCQQEYTIKYFDEILPNLTELIEFSVYREISF